MNNLCIDIGNTRVKIAIFAHLSGALLHLERVETLKKEKIIELCQTWAVENAIISTVRAADAQLEADLAAAVLGQTLILSADTPCPIRNMYHTPATLGKDRLAAVVGAAALYPQQSALVIDAGTCIKYDYIDADGAYWGGSISAGLQMRYDALAHFTARLPALRPSAVSLDLTGTDTPTSMQTGVEYGLRFEVAGFIAEYQKRHDAPLLVIFTGGDLSFFENMLNKCIFAQPNLLLIGLHQILKYNVGQSKTF